MIEQNLEKLIAGAHEVLPAGELEKKLAKNKPLKVKLGMDPTSPDLHLGHAVVLSKLKVFQDYGHEIILIIGDFTARIGDPTGRSKTRPALTEQEIEEHAKTYIEQVGKILDIKKTKIVRNSEWLDKLTIKDFVKLCGKVTLSRIIERDDFEKRLKEKVTIGFHELLYPLMQGYDSVALHSDIEFGGTDQTFNNLMGRYLQEQYGQEPQVVITMPLLVGLDGVQKMSKSYGNYVGLFEPANSAFGKLMSISDDLMWTYFELLLNKTKKEIASMKQEISSGKIHPMDLKKSMAHDIVERFWSKPEADEAKISFEELFQKRDGSFEHAEYIALGDFANKPTWIVDFLRFLDPKMSSSDAKRLIEAGAVTLNGEKITDFKAVVNLKDGMHLKVGKHKFYKLT